MKPQYDNVNLINKVTPTLPTRVTLFIPYFIMLKILVTGVNVMRGGDIGQPTLWYAHVVDFADIYKSESYL